MKRLFLLLFAGCLLATAASAQTLPAGTIFINPSLTNLSFNSITVSYEGEKESFSRFGLQAMGGYAIMDDFAIIAGLGVQGGKYEDNGITALNVFAGARYYLPVAPGFYAGLNLALGNASVNTDDDFKANSISLEANVGYDFFLTKRIAFEPAISYTYGLSTKVQDMSINLSMFTLNFGFLFLL